MLAKINAKKINAKNYSCNKLPTIDTSNNR